MANRIARAYDRVPIHCWVTLAVHGRKMWVRAANISVAGAMIESLFPIRAQSFVEMKSRMGLLVGGGYVRYCKRKGLIYRIGVRFARPVAARF
jgi:PilZ domain-containing protein